MNAVTKPAFAHKLPPIEPTLAQLGATLIRMGRAHSQAAGRPLSFPSWHMDQIEADQEAAADAFFTALERETGISRDMIREIGGMA